MIEQKDPEDDFGFAVTCDITGCSNYEDLEVRSFYEAIEEMHSRGWKSRKENDEWIHVCPSCVEDGK